MSINQLEKIVLLVSAVTLGLVCGLGIMSMKHSQQLMELESQVQDNQVKIIILEHRAGLDK